MSAWVAGSTAESSASGTIRSSQDGFGQIFCIAQKRTHWLPTHSKPAQHGTEGPPKVKHDCPLPAQVAAAVVGVPCLLDVECLLEGTCLLLLLLGFTVLVVKVVPLAEVTETMLKSVTHRVVVNFMVARGRPWLSVLFVSALYVLV